MRSIAALLAFLLALAAPVWANATTDALRGTFFGIRDAAGFQLEIAPSGEGYSGRIVDRAGTEVPFDASATDYTAATIVTLDGQTAQIEMTAVPFGVEMAILPFTPDGDLVPGRVQRLFLVRSGLRLPQPPADFQAPPETSVGRVAGNSFVRFYPFWGPRGVRNGYLALPERFRTVMKFFPAVQLEVIWNLCLAQNADVALGVALRGQGVACDEVVDTMSTVLRAGRFDDFRREVDRERETLGISVRCADRYVETKGDCDRAARAVAEAAVSLRTAGTVLSRYR